MKIKLTAILFAIWPCLLSGQTFTEVIPMACGDTSIVGGLGYPTWSPPSIIDRPAFGHASLLGDFIEPNILQYIAPPHFAGSDTVVIECARATQILCETGIYVFDISCPEVIQPVYAGEVDCRDSVYMSYLSGWATPVLIGEPQHGSAHIIVEPADGAGVMYSPDSGYEGLDWVLVNLFQGQDTALFIFQVYCNLASSTTEAAILRPHYYPNPVTDFLYVQVSLHANPVVSIFDALGRRLHVPLQLMHDRVELNVSRLSAGLYRVSGFDDLGRRFVVGFVKK